jgi:hypothetical protein
MHRVSTRIGVFIIVLLVVTTGISSSQNVQSENWKLFSAGIKMALKGDNPGVQQSAILLVIKHGEKLDIKDAVSDMIRCYRNAKDVFSRELALLAIFQVDKDSAFELLFEQLNAQTADAKKEITRLYSR